MYIGWRVVAGAFAGMVLANGMFTYAFTVLVDPIREEFGASLEQVMYGLTLGTLFGLIMGPLVGALIDRFSVRILMTLGCLFTASGLFAISNAQSIGAFSWLLAVTMSLSLASMSSMPGSAVVSRWFSTNRGRALGIASIGSSFGGVLVPALLTFWISLYGWRDALQMMALVTVLLVMPIIWLTVRNQPSDLGLTVENQPAPQDNESAVHHTGMSMLEILRTPAFWIIGLSMGMVFAAFSSMLANLAPYAAGLGVGENQISTMISILALGGVVGKFVFGMAADRINLRKGLWLAHFLLCVAFLILLTEPTYPLMVLASVFFGLSTGGLLPVWSAMMARVFGVASFGRAMGAMGPVITLSILPAYALVGRLFDTTGSYSLGLMVFSGVILLAALLLVPLKYETASRS
ncbi:MFS transporter [bacterium]|jgi:predicted MFS family arabinose efflux permease|nr:MFS transporter [bacterium]